MTNCRMLKLSLLGHEAGSPHEWRLREERGARKLSFTNTLGKHHG